MPTAALIIGGSRGLGRALVDALAPSGADLIISARESDALHEAAEAAKQRGAGAVHAVAVDLAALDADAAAAYVDDCFARLPALSQVYVTAAQNDVRDAGTESAQAFTTLMAANATGICLMAAALAERMATRPGNITVVSSVAAVRPRRRNLAYAAAKRALETYVGGLRHATASGPLRIQIVRAGYLRTRLSAGHDLKITPADPADAAARILAWRDDDYAVRYVPRFWWLLAMGLRVLPWRVFRRLDV